MKKILRTVIVTVGSAGLLSVTGCTSPDGRPDNTGTGALLGGAFGALIGAAADRGHSGAGALIGGAAGLIAGGLIGHAMDQEQKARLQQQYPETWYKVQNNDAVYAGTPPPPPPPVVYVVPAPPPPPQPPPPADEPASAAATPPAPPAPAPAAQTPTASTPQMQPLTVKDIKALTAAGVKPDAIEKEIDMSQSKFTPQDIAAAQQANPSIDPEVIAYMQSRSS